MSTARHQQTSPWKRLVLFDIDGTLLWGGSLWKECFLGALEHYYPGLQFPRVPFGGKTDLQICREIMEHAGFPENEIERGIKLVVDLYVARARELAPQRAHEVTVLPGVKDVLDRLARHPDVFLGLLTGNVRSGALIKLSTVGLEGYFKFGVYCDDHHDRYQMPAIAVERFHREHGRRFQGKEIVIIGDTIHDVNCGKSMGVRTIAVGTGHGIPTEELLAQEPDFYFKDLSAAHEVVSAILEEMP